MKLFALLLVTLISFSGVCDEIKEGIDVNIKLLNCLDEKIPNSSIEDPENRSAKSLFLVPSVIENTRGMTQVMHQKNALHSLWNIVRTKYDHLKSILRNRLTRISTRSHNSRRVPLRCTFWPPIT